MGAIVGSFESGIDFDEAADIPERTSVVPRTNEGGYKSSIDKDYDQCLEFLEQTKSGVIEITKLRVHTQLLIDAEEAYRSGELFISQVLCFAAGLISQRSPFVGKGQNEHVLLGNAGVREETVGSRFYINPPQVVPCKVKNDDPPVETIPVGTDVV